MAQRVIVEWTRGSVRVGMVEGGRLRALYSQPLGASGDVTHPLRELLKRAKLSAATATAVVSREQVITRVVKFPSTNQAELAQMVELYAKAQLPYPREQTVVDFHVLSQQEGFSMVAVVVGQREVIDRQLSVLREAGLSVDVVTVSAWGVLAWYRLAARGRSAEPVLVVNVDDTRTDLVLVAENRILSSRSVGQGCQDWVGGGEAAELLIQEVERSRASIRKELPGTEVRSVVLTGAGPLGQWVPPMSQRLATPVTVIEAGGPFKGRVPAAGSISPVAVGGVASSDPKALLNLSPPEIVGQTRHRRQVRVVWMLSLLVVAVLAAGASVISLEVARQRRLAGQLEQVLGGVTPTAKQIQEKTRAAQLVRSILSERRELVALLAEVFRATPSTMALEGVTFERARREIALRGTADSTQAVLDFLRQLRQLPGVAGADLKYSTPRSTPDGDRTDFEVLVRQRGTS